MKLELINRNVYTLSGAYVEITSRCNLRCKHCYNESGELKTEFTLDQIKNIIEDIPHKESAAFTISGGEPLLHPHFWDILDLVLHNNFARVLVITNGTLIDESAAKKFAERNCSIQVSINGFTATQHDQLCGTGNFNRTMSGIDKLLQAGAKNIIVRCTITQYNKNNLVEFAKFFSTKGIKKIAFGVLRKTGRELKNDDVLGLNGKELLDTIDDFNSNAIIKELKSDGLLIDVPEAISLGCPLVFHNDSPIKLTPRIDTNGDVFLCQSFTNKLYSIGNIKTDRLKNLFNGVKFINLINFFCTGLNYMHECENCFWKESCGRGCIAVNLDHGSIQNTDGDCVYRREKMENDLFLK